MKDAGIGLMALGILAIVGSLFVEVGRSVGYPVGEVANLHAMHIQSLIFHGGCFAFLAGAVFYAGGVINQSVRAGSDRGDARASVVAEEAEEEAAHHEHMAKDSPWMIVIIGVGLAAILVLAAIVARSPQPPASDFDNIPDMNMAPDENAPYPALEPPVELNRSVPR